MRSFKEDLLQNQLEQNLFTPLWEIIYSESSKGNDLLFSDEDKSGFETFGFSGLSADNTNNLTHHVVKLMSQNSLSQAKLSIEKLTKDERRWLFGFYKSYLAKLRRFRKSLMH